MRKTLLLLLLACNRANNANVDGMGCLEYLSLVIVATGFRFAIVSATPRPVTATTALRSKTIAATLF